MDKKEIVVSSINKCAYLLWRGHKELRTEIIEQQTVFIFELSEGVKESMHSYYNDKDLQELAAATRIVRKKIRGGNENE